MGGIGRYATVSLLLPPRRHARLGGRALRRAARARRRGRRRASSAATSRARARAIVVDVTLLGDAGRLLLRSGARPGDLVVVTGTLGRRGRGRSAAGRGRPARRGRQLVATGRLDRVVGRGGVGVPARAARPAAAVRGRPLDRGARPRARRDGPLGRPLDRPARAVPAQRARRRRRRGLAADRPQDGRPGPRRRRRPARARAARRRGLPAAARGGAGRARRGCASWRACSASEVTAGGPASSRASPRCACATRRASDRCCRAGTTTSARSDG